METYAVAIPAIDTYIAVMYIHVCRCSSCPVVQTVELKTTPIPFYLQSMYSSDIRGVCQSRKTIRFPKHLDHLTFTVQVTGEE